MIDGDPNVLSGRTTSQERFGRPARRPTRAPMPLERRSEELVRLLKQVDDKPKPHDVHQLRTTIRRVETLLLPDTHATQLQRKVRKVLDRIRRRAGKVRDLDVHLKVMRSLPRTIDVEVRDELRNLLRKARQKRLKRLLRVLGNARDRGIVKRLRHLVTEVHGAMDAAASDPARSLIEVLDGFAAARRTAEPLEGDKLHEFRIATKRLRYRAEAIVAHPGAAEAVVELKRVQDAIGAWHDWLTLAARAEGALGDASALLVAAVRARADVQLGKAVQVVERVARRLETLRPIGRRKGVRRVTSPVPALPRQGAGASA